MPRTSSGRRVGAAAVAAVLGVGLAVAHQGAVHAASLPAHQMERLDRGLISVRSGSGNLVTWRLLGTDSPSTAFNVYRSGAKLNSSPITGATDYLDAGAPTGASYTVRAVVNGTELAASAPSLDFGNGYLEVPISKPANSPTGATYSANDASVGDLDGDGVLEIVLKWDPSDAKDNSQSGATSDVFVDAYKLNGTRLWRINLGPNIRAGAHYTQFQVWDYDGDGRAEVAMKTGDGTVDGTGRVIGDGSQVYRNSSGYILTGPEYLTMFDGKTGAALSTVDYVTGRGNVGSWGNNETYGNRVDRFLAATAYLDGVHPSLIEARGYYARTTLTAWDFTGGKLVKRWAFDSASAGTQYGGQGDHQLAVADVDGDGKDEIVYGAECFDDNGTVLWNTDNGHGDALHVGDLDPSRPGLEVFKVDEDGTKPSSWFADAKTGQVLWSTAANGDNGRGVSDDIWAGSPGAESWSARVASLKNTSGQDIGRKPSSINFLAWWDADPVRELLDGNHIDKYGTDGDTNLLTASDVHSNNGTKSTPSLSGDLFGDWREEVIWPRSDDQALRIYTTTIPTTIRIPTLLHDLQYREAIAWQNTAYNQPPHPSFFIGDGMSTPPWPNITVPGGQTDTTPPSAPTNLRVLSAGSTAVRLTWGASSDNVGVTGYDVYKWATRIDGTKTSLTITLTGLEPGRSYAFSVRAHDAAGNVSGAASVSVTTGTVLDTTPPSAPSGLTLLSSTATSVRLSWTAATDNVAVTAYDILANGSRVSGTAGSTTATITGLKANTSYSFTVKAKDANNNIGPASSALSVRTPSS